MFGWLKCIRYERKSTEPWGVYSWKKVMFNERLAFAGQNEKKLKGKLTRRLTQTLKMTTDASFGQQQQSYSGLRSPGRSHSTFWNDSWVQALHSITIMLWEFCPFNIWSLITMLSGLIYPRCQRFFPCLGARELSSRAARVSCEAARKVADQHFALYASRRWWVRRPLGFRAEWVILN